MNVKTKRKKKTSAPRIGTFERALQKAEKQLEAAVNDGIICKSRLNVLSVAIPGLQQTIIALKRLLAPSELPSDHPSSYEVKRMMERPKSTVPAFVPDHLKRFIESQAAGPEITSDENQFLRDDGPGVDLVP